MNPCDACIKHDADLNHLRNCLWFMRIKAAFVFLLQCAHAEKHYKTSSDLHRERIAHHQGDATAGHFCGSAGGLEGNCCYAESKQDIKKHSSK